MQPDHTGRWGIFWAVTIIGFFIIIAVTKGGGEEAQTSATGVWFMISIVAAILIAVWNSASRGEYAEMLRNSQDTTTARVATKFGFEPSARLLGAGGVILFDDNTRSIVIHEVSYPSTEILSARSIETTRPILGSKGKTSIMSGALGGIVAGPLGIAAGLAAGALANNLVTGLVIEFQTSRLESPLFNFVVFAGEARYDDPSLTNLRHTTAQALARLNAYKAKDHEAEKKLGRGQ